MKWIYVVGVVVFIPIIVKLIPSILKGLLQIVAWCLAVASIIGGVAMLINGQIIYGILGLVLGVVLSMFLPEVDWEDIDYWLW